MNLGSDLNMNFGNLLVLISAVFWALHVQMVDSYSQRYPNAFLAVAQFSVCAGLSAIAAVIYRLAFLPVAFDGAYLQGLWNAKIAVLYGGILSVGVGYTLQLWVQKKVAPTRAAIVLSMEAVFALIGGYIILQEAVDIPKLLGAGSLMAAMLLMNLPKKRLTE